jgi:hypothetical protein
VTLTSTTPAAPARKPGQGSKWLRPSTRQALYLRGGFCCVYCGAGFEGEGVVGTIDHVIPSVLGGSNAPSNLVCACQRCNSRRQDTALTVWLAQLAAEGVDVDGIARRVRNQTRRQLDRAAGLTLAAQRR